MRRALLVLLLLGSVPAWADTLSLDASDPARTTVAQLRYRGAVVVPAGTDEVGGLSALWVGPEGKKIVAMSDIGRVFEGRLSWDKAGHLAGVSFKPGLSLKNIDGGKFPRRADTEALVADGKGGWYVAFERDHRIWHYPSLSGTPTALPPWPGLAELPRNRGIESMVRFSDGRLLILAEASREDGLTHAAWLLVKGEWLTLDYRTEAGFDPADAALLPDGDLVVLERRFSLFGGFQSRLVRVGGEKIKAGGTLEGVELARLTAPLLTENFEGLSIRTNKAGETELYLVSDNNLSLIQRTILAVFVLSHGPEKAPTP